MDKILRNRTAIVGVGFTPMVRKTDRSLGSLALEAARNAITDAGLRPADIDGYAGTPVAFNPSSAHSDGVDEVSGRYIVSSMGLKNVRWLADLARGLMADAIVEAIHALHSGSCRYVLIVRAMHNPVGVRYQQTDLRAAGGPEQFNAPYGVQAIGRTAFWLNRYMHDYGATKSELYQLAKTLRDHALLNPFAYWRKPLTEEEYLGARQIFEPMSVFDCDIPVTGAGAIVLTTAERATHLPHKPAFISAFATGLEQPDAIYQRSGIGPREVQAAQLYDGFLPFVWYWLEAMGFCRKGEAHSFALNGNVSLKGTLPVTTFGGSMGEGRLHGMGHVREAALQVMGRAAQRQVPGLTNCLVAIGFEWVPGGTFMLSAG